jgi:predicted PurR-regulated permease PerM
MPPRRTLAIFTSGQDSRLAILQGLLIAAIVIAALYFGREVLLPLTLAILISFVLTPPLILLRRLKVPRVLAVGIVVSAAFAFLLAVGWAISHQLSDLAEDLPAYQVALSKKIESLRESAAGTPALKKASEALQRLDEELASPKPQPSVGVEAEVPAGPEVKEPLPVEIREPAPRPFQFYQEILEVLLPPLAMVGIILLFVIFILIQREDLRDRLLRLFGASDLQRASAAMTDAAQRLSKYFLIQVLINTAYGVFIALMLWLIGIPSPIVWGVLATLMRFVPYVGSFIAVAPPLLLAAVVEPGWTTFLMIGVLFLISELAMGQVVEPLVYGHRTGLSPIAVIISTVFWTWLWGPLGLLLAMPLTVLLVVLGKHIESLSFLEVLLGDAPAFTPEQSFYQRMLSGDSAEATYQAELCLKEGRPLVNYLDEVVLKGLQLAEADAERGALQDDHLELVDATVHEVMENLAEFEPRRWFRSVTQEEKVEQKEGGLASLTSLEEGENEALPILERGDLAPGWASDDAVLCIGGRTPLDEAAAGVLSGLLRKHGLNAKSVEREAISPGHIASLETSEAKLVCLSYLGVGGTPAHVRYLVRRLRRILPAGCKILVAYWQDGDSGLIKALESTAEADGYASNLKDAAEFVVEAARKPATDPETITTPVIADEVPTAGVAPEHRRRPEPQKPARKKAVEAG